MASLRRVRGLAMAVLSALLAGCTDAPPVVPEPPTITVLTPHVWTGNEALLSSAAFAGTPDAALPVVTLHDSALALRRVDDTTLAVRMPQMNGAADLRLQAGGSTVLLDPIHVHGFRGRRDGPVLGGFPYVWPRPGMPWMIGFGDSGLVIADIRDNSVRAFSANIHRPWCMWSPGIDARDPTRILVRDGPSVHRGFNECSGPVRVWQAPPPGMALESLPVSGGSDPHMMLRTADSVYLFVFDNWVSFFGPGGSSTYVFGEGVYGLRWSEDGHRVATFGDQRDPAGVPVYDGAAGQIAYRIPSLLGPEAAAFSDDGDTLFLVGLAAQGGRRTLVKAMSTTGAVVAVASLDGTQATDVALDPTANLLYLLRTAGRFVDPTVIDVVDRATLTIVAHLEVPLFTMFSSRLVLDPVQRRLYIVEPSWDAPYFPGPGPSTILEFELLP